MLKIDNTLLEEVGLASLPSSEKNSFLKHIYETLEMRVGIRLADQMTNQQLDEFEKYFEAKDDAGAFKWLETNFPDYKEIVQQEFDKLKTEVSQTAPQILSASQDKAAGHGAQAGQAPQTPAGAPAPQTPPPAPPSPPGPPSAPPPPPGPPPAPRPPAPSPPSGPPGPLPPRPPSPHTPPSAPPSPAPAPRPNPGPGMPPAPGSSPSQPPQRPPFPPQQPPAGPSQSQ